MKIEKEVEIYIDGCRVSSSFPEIGISVEELGQILSFYQGDGEGIEKIREGLNNAYRFFCSIDDKTLEAIGDTACRMLYMSLSESIERFNR